MYTATMEYQIKTGALEEFVLIWERDVLSEAVKQPGFVRMQLLVREEEVMAIGSWKDKKDAENFMSTGVFKKLMKTIGALLSGDPKPRIWDLRSFK